MNRRLLIGLAALALLAAGGCENTSNGNSAGSQTSGNSSSHAASKPADAQAELSAAVSASSSGLQNVKYKADGSSSVNGAAPSTTQSVLEIDFSPLAEHIEITNSTGTSKVNVNAAGKQCGTNSNGTTFAHAGVALSADVISPYSLGAKVSGAHYDPDVDGRWVVTGNVQITNSSVSLDTATFTIDPQTNLIVKIVQHSVSSLTVASGTVKYDSTTTESDFVRNGGVTIPACT